MVFMCLALYKERSWEENTKTGAVLDTWNCLNKKIVILLAIADQETVHNV